VKACTYRPGDWVVVIAALYPGTVGRLCQAVDWPGHLAALRAPNRVWTTLGGWAHADQLRPASTEELVTHQMTQAGDL
jgi:hypothetical protein